MNPTEKLVFSMLQTSTGAALCDSGDAYGRHWEKNKKMTFAQFKNLPEVTLWGGDGGEQAYYTISVFHFITKYLFVDALCERFNKRPVDNWHGKYYGVSDKGERWLNAAGLSADGEAVNTYNHESNLSQVLQFQTLKDLSGERYVLLQIHQGCDVRGGYTDAKLFKYKPYTEFFGIENVFGEITLSDGNSYRVSNFYDGHSLSFEEIDPTQGDIAGQTYMMDKYSLPRAKRGPRDNEKVYDYLENTGLKIVSYGLDLA